MRRLWQKGGSFSRHGRASKHTLTPLLLCSTTLSTGEGRGGASDTQTFLTQCCVCCDSKAPPWSPPVTNPLTQPSEAVCATPGAR